MTEWLLNPNLWFIVGFLIIGLGMALDFLDVALIFGGTAIVLSLLIAFTPWLDSWEKVSLAFIGITVLVFLAFMRVERNENKDFDINDD